MTLPGSDIIHSIAQWVEPWQSAYSASRALGIVVIFGHLGALLVGGGVAVSADLGSLRAGRVGAELDHQLALLRRAHGVVAGALGVMVVTGVLLALSDIETFVVSPWFWLKMGLIGLLVVNGAVLRSTSETLHRDRDRFDALWPRLRIVSTVSLVLWLATVLAGTILQNAA